VIRQLVRSPEAENDLIEIWTYIAQDNAISADKLVDRLYARSLSLIAHPSLGVRRTDIARDVRMLTVGNYLILYRSHRDRIEIIRYIRGARQLGGLLGRDD
jgi:toxin ParE1/3/4